ncbi:HipA domain-containing protein [Mesorhizobium sp.]|uniref:type II toxin-antitoxin system HipA family toxin n=1 Tax=Mesorhizobium sp. TaxID=1871066 RepID=UPI000FE89A3E|nr:HipA domain-containing protein [Mesorhizobium sp.]RWA81748.1 MAG: type II toxin-antitoxin system HipA family toxin [Mesorhizobium sp.]
MPDVSVLDVRLYDEPVGTLTHLQGDRTIFAFNEDYVENPDRPTLSLSFKDDLGGLITRIRPTQRVVPPFFSNLLPEGGLRRYLAERAGVNQQREFFLLWMLGLDLPGALSIHPAAGDGLPPGDVEDLPKNAKPNALRFSLAGVQLKFSAFQNAGKGGGLTIPAEGVGGSWIVKLPSQQFTGVPENEFSMMTIAGVIGMEVPIINLVDLDAIAGIPEGVGELKGQALAISRFDRTGDGPVHTEDFAQVFGVFPDDKYKRASYANIARVIGTEAGDVGAAEFIRRLVFSALIGNGDMHLKNWSLIYPDRRSAALSPAYDLVSTIPYMKGEDTAALNYSRTKKMAKLDTDELRHLAAKALLPEKLVVDTAAETVQRFRQVWEAEKTHLPLAAAVVKAIDAHAPTVPLFSELA